MDPQSASTAEPRTGETIHDSAPEFDLLARLGLGWYRTNAEGQICAANEPLARLAGLPDAAALVGLELQGVLEGESGAAVREVKLCRRDGLRLPVLVVESRSGGAAGAGPREGLVVDLSVLRPARERLELLATAMAAARDGLMITDTQAGPVIQYVNAAMCRISGYSAAELVGQSPQILEGPRTGNRLADALERARTTGEGCDVETLNYRKGGQEVPVECQVAPIRGEAGEITGCVTIYRDVSERRALAEQLRQAQKLEAIGQLAAGVAHDFNNLLTAIFGYTALASRTLPAGHAAIKSLQRVEQAARQASGVAGGLLAFSRRHTLERRPVNLRLVLEETARLLRRMMPARIELVVENPPEPPVAVNADSMQIQQLLFNLAINARDALPSGGTLRLALDKVADAPEVAGGVTALDGWARLRVIDNGVGIAPELHERIFEPFFTTRPPGVGTGLGLAIADSIVKEHAGRITVTSAVGRGAEFCVWLPCLPDAVLAPTRADFPKGKGETILLAEDHEYVREIIATMLKGSGYSVIEASDGAKVTERFWPAADVIDLLVLDIDLPRRSGLEFLGELRNAGVTTPAIVITGNVHTWNGEPLGPHTRLLPKPFQLADLGLTVRRMLGEGRAKKGGR
jgi:PAS domain S-box-containing protein